MARYIDADKLYNDLIFPDSQTARIFKEILDDAPTEEVTPIVRGKWIYSHDVFSRRTCNQCNYSQIIVDGMADNYCPKCGAKMEESKDDE